MRLALLAVFLALPGCALSAGPIQLVLGQSDVLACEGASTLSYGQTVKVNCNGTLRWTTGGELSANAVGAVEAAARGAAAGAVPGP